MNKQPFSRIIALVLSVALVFTMIPFTVSVKAAGCTHEHDAECGYVEGHYVTDDDLEDSDIKDDELEDVELENDYVEGMPATSANMEGRYVEGTPCRHVCDENCGGLVDSGKMPGKSGEESELVVVAEFDELDEDRLYQGYDYGEITSQDDLILPDTLTGKDADGEAITIENVTWKSEPGFDPAVSEFYDFTPVLPQGYILAEDATAPVISVFIRPEGGLQINPLVSITGNTVTISETDAVADIKAAIQGLWSTYNTVIVEGIKNNADSYLSLNIPTGMTVKWQATYSDSSGSGDLISLQGGGTFEVDGGSLTSTRPNCSAIYVLGPNSVIVTDGTVSAVGMRTINLLVASSTVTINGGEVKYTGTDTGTAAIYVGPNATNNVVTVNGGTVTGEGNNYGIYLGNDSSAVAMTGGTVQSIGRQAINLGSGVVYYSDGNITGSSDTNRIRNDGTAKGFYTGNNSGLFNNFSTNLFKLDELVSLKLRTSGTAYDGNSVTTEDVVAELLDGLTYTSIIPTGTTGIEDLTTGTFTFNNTVNSTAVSLNATGTFTGTKLSVSFTIDNIALNIDKSGAQPEVTSISPAFVSAEGDTTVTLTGRGLTGATVTVDGQTVSVDAGGNDTQITFTAPQHTPGTVNLVVTFSGGGSTSTKTLTYVPANLFPIFDAVQAYGRGGGSGGALKAALDSSDTSNNTVIITNDGAAITGANQTLTLNIPPSATVKWEASLTGSTNATTALLSLPGNGTLEVATNGLLKNDGASSRTIHTTGANANLIVNGGTVQRGGDSEYAILADGANAKVTVSGTGTVAVTSSYGTAIRAEGDSHLITVSGTVQGGSGNNSEGIFSFGNSAAVIISGGSVSGTSPVVLGGDSTVYYGGGTVAAGGITRATPFTSATGYYTGDGSGAFESYFGEGTNLFKLDGVTLSPATGIAVHPATVTATLSDKLTVTDVSVSGLSSGYTINSDKTVTFSGITPTTSITLTVTGTITSANIPVSFDTETFSVSIVDKIPLTITGVTATNRVYNGTTTVALSGGTLQGIQGNDQVGFTLGNGTMDNANVGDGKSVTTNITLTGADANKYQLTPPTVTVNITPKALTISGFSISKQYDGNNTVAGFGTLTFSGFENSETANVVTTGVTATYVNANAGTGKAITFGGSSFGMTDGNASAGNYSITQPTYITGTITKAPLTGATITLAAGPYTYTGSAITPAVTSVSAGGISAVPTDYTMDYSSNISVGTATVTLTATASGNFSGSAGTTFTIGKANGPNAPASVTGSYTGDGTTFTYTVTPIAGAEYSNDNTSWQDSNIFTGFTTASPATAFYARIKETATHEAGAAGNTGAITFTKLDDRAAPPLAFAVSDGGFPKTVTITLVTGAEYSFNGTTYSQTNIYTSNSGESLTLYIRLAETDTHNASSPSTVTIDTSKQNQAEPPMFTLDYNANGDTDYTVTIPATTGAEYSFDGTTWSGTNIKTGCLPGETITGYKRMTETSDLNASPSTSASVTLPLFQVKPPTATPSGGNFTTSQDVTLSCTTTDASIYYTTDGTTPTTGSTIYSVAFTIADTTTVKAIAVKAGMTDSAMLEVTFTKAPILSGDATLSALTISSGTLTPSFSPAATSYTATVANSVSSVTVTATAKHANATVSGAGTKALVVGANTITVTVTAQDGTAKTYTITITREGSGSSNGGGGGSSSSGSSSSPRYNITTAKQHGMPKVATMTYTGTVQDNQLTGTITKDMVQADVNAAGTDPDGIALTFIITNNSSYNNQTISIAGDALDLLRSSGVKYVQVQTGIFRFHFDSAAIQSLDSQTTGTVTVSAAPVSPLSDAANAAIGNRTVFDFTVHDSTGNTVTSYGSGTVTRGIRYTAADTEHTGSLFIVKIVDGTVQWIDRSSYDSGWMIWSGDSNSVYGVGYKAPAPAFTDITGHWAKDDIDFAASRGLISGTGATAFSPDTAITRADFLMALGRLSSADMSGYTTSNFTDVPAANPAMPYIQWAVTNNIVQGIGNNNFGPDHHITREQMAVIMVNYAKATNYPLPISRQAVTFADDAAISAYAKEAVKAIQQTGVISGKADNLFDPQGSVTRAEAGTILRRFTKLVIDGNTARGWVRNDIGQWQYITPDGKTVTGWLNTANGIWYWFDNKGIMAAGEWIQISGKWYYFYGDGQMATNVIIDGYTIGEDGVMQESEH